MIYLDSAATSLWHPKEAEERMIQALRGCGNAGRGAHDATLDADRIVFETRMRHELDHIDAKILNLLRENARMPLKEIAEHVFLSSPAVSARIERLEKEGYITGYQVKLNPALLGYPIKAFINLEVEPVQKKEFYPYIEKVHNVVECNCVTGDYSMLIEGLFVSTIELDQFIGELQHFGRTRTQIVFSTSVEHRQVTAHEAEE